MPATWNMAWVWGVSSRLTPLLLALLHWLARRLFRATCKVTREDEHAVSTAMAGPFSPKVYAMRPAVTLHAHTHGLVALC